MSNEPVHCVDCGHELTLIAGTWLHRFVGDYDKDCVCYRLKIACEPDNEN